MPPLRCSACRCVTCTRCCGARACSRSWNEHSAVLMNAVLRFADSASAAAAAADMARVATIPQPGPAQPTVSIPGHPNALAATYSYNSYGADQHPATVISYTPHGAYVLCQTAQADHADAAAALIAQTLDIQGPRIDTFAPTDPAKFAALHFQDDPLGAAAAFSTAGVAAMSYNQTLVYQARDPAAAAQLAQDLADLVLQLQPSATPIGGVDFLPTSRCVQSDRPGGNGQRQYSCYAPADSLTIEAHSADATGAPQETAAQYKMLLAK